MKMFVPILLLASVALAEPPVGDGYPAARTSHEDHHHNHHDDHQAEYQRSPSQEYGAPSDTIDSTNNVDGYQYNTPNAGNSPHVRSQSRFPPATVRVSFNQRFSSAAARKSNPATHSHHQHPAPSTRLSQEYGPPSSRSLSQEYGAPAVVSARTLSTEYGMPDARSTPSQEYGVPVVAARSNQNQHSSSNFRNAQSSHSQSHEHTSPASRSQFHADSESHGYSSPSARSNEISDEYEAPNSGFGSRTAPSSTYGAPSSRSSSLQASSRSSDSVNVDSISQTYGAPTQKALDETYGAPSARGLSQEYGAPSSRANLMTSAIASSAASSSRSVPSSSYLPASRSAPPSEQYGAPEPQDSAAQGYDYARARALEELQNQEPASYDFGYQISDQESGSDFGHSETREADKAQGSYFVVRPDGSKQTVEYEADERGFKPRISVEPAASGYDQNAQDLARAGPY